MNGERVAIAYDCLYPFTTGGGERQYEAFARHFARRGLQVDYLTTRQWEEAPEDLPYAAVPISGPLRLYNSEGVRRSGTALRYAAALFRTLVTRRKDYDVLIVSALPVLNVFAARAALARSRTRVVVDYLEVWGYRQWLTYAGPIVGNVAWLLQRFAIRCTPVASCHSQLSARRLRIEGFRGELLISPGLIDTSRLDESHSGTSPAATPPYVLYAGRHIPDKQVEVLPAAVAEARSRVPGLRLIILGEGPSGPQIESAIDALGAPDWIERRGFVSEDELKSLMAGAAVLANPSRREGYGLVVVESASFGTPVVLVNHEGNASTELVEPDVNGFISPTPAPGPVSDAIVRAVHGGVGLRERARRWYEAAVVSKSIAATVDRIISVTGLDDSKKSDQAKDNRDPGR